MESFRNLGVPDEAGATAGRATRGVARDDGEASAAETR